MIEVSQASHVVCRHTAFVSVDQETLEPLPSPIQVIKYRTLLAINERAREGILRNCSQAIEWEIT